MIKDGFELFSHESAVSQSASGLTRIMILQSLDLLFRNWRVYLKTKNINDKAVFFAHASSFSSFLRPVWLRKDKSSFEKVLSLINASEVRDDEGVPLVDYFTELLDKLELTKIDTKEPYDRNNVIKSNKHHGYT